MAKLLESVARPVKEAQQKQVKTTKLCLKCGKVKNVNDFYTNKDWIDQLGRDIWCKDCVAKLATKDEIREYFWENHKEWNEKIWTAAKNRAEKLASNNLTFQKANEERRRSILERLTCQQVPGCMVMPGMYHYVENGKDGQSMSYAEAKANGEIELDTDKENNREFNGYFTPKELEYLENYYEGLETDFALDTENLRDYATKLSKASLQADKAQDDYAAGRCDFSVVKDAMTLFDTLSKSANFAACKRNPGDKGGLGSWSELTLKLETSGHPCTRKIEWEPDEVDKTIEEFRQIVESIGLDNV